MNGEKLPGLASGIREMVRDSVWRMQSTALWYRLLWQFYWRYDSGDDNHLAATLFSERAVRGRSASSGEREYGEGR